MNRRSFFTKLGLAAASLAILPAATTYDRKWVAPTIQTPLFVPNTAWINAEFEMSFLHSPLTWKMLNEASGRLSVICHSARFIPGKNGKMIQV